MMLTRRRDRRHTNHGQQRLRSLSCRTARRAYHELSVLRANINSEQLYGQKYLEQTQLYTYLYAAMYR